MIIITMTSFVPWLGDSRARFAVQRTGTLAPTQYSTNQVVSAKYISIVILKHNSQIQADRNTYLNNVMRICKKRVKTHLGWRWLLPLRTADLHHLQSLRIPATDEQQDFDSLVLSLAKILIDSLNEKSLRKLIPYEKREAFKDKRGIALLETVLHLNNLEGSDIHTDFLRKLQNLRSSGSAHRKGESYSKIAKHFGVENQSLRQGFANILNSASYTLDYFIVLVNSGRIREILEKNQVETGYAILDEMIGIAESDKTDASVKHDDAIYELETKL